MSDRSMTQRELWHALGIGPEGVSLCSVCRFADHYGNCDDGWTECHHPLAVVSLELTRNAQYGSDCWAFRPKYDRDTTTDIFGVMLGSDAWRLATEAPTPSS